MHGGRSFGISRSIESVTPLSLIIILQPIHLDWQKQNISPTSPSSPQPAQSRSANQAPAQLPAPSLTISGTASVALTLRRPRQESLLCFDSCSEPSHNGVMACCSRLMLLYIAAAIYTPTSTDPCLCLFNVVPNKHRS